MKNRTAAVIVAHPDDETLWAGGTIIKNSSYNFFVACLCRKSDPDRSPRFFRALQILDAEGTIEDMDDGPEQNPLNPGALDETILKLLPGSHFDLIITHSPRGEYTRHIRHEETGRSVIRLWQSGQLNTGELRIFAYEDGRGKYYPRPEKDADLFYDLSDEIWEKKYRIITDIYGFSKDSFEALTTPRSESFRRFSNYKEVIKFYKL